MITVHRALAPIVALPLLLGAVACSDKKITEEERVEKALDAGIRALEDNDLDAAKKVLSDDYKDKAGRSKLQMAIMANFVLKRGPVRMVKKITAIDIKDGKATVNLDVFAIQGAEAIKTARDLLPQRSKKLEVTVSLKKDGDDYVVTAIDGDKVKVPGAAM